MTLMFREFQEMNRTRCDEAFHPTKEWPIQNWALAIAGEAGELCNLVKKVIRGDFTLEEKRQEILEEIADVMTYCDLAMTHLDADTATELMAKFDKVSARIGYEATP